MPNSKLAWGGFVTTLLLWPALCAGQTVSIVSGNGQLICPVCPGPVTEAFAPLVVSVTDANGNPEANATVQWAVTPGLGSGGSPNTAQTVTGANGQASYTFPLVLPNPGTSYFPTAITATVAGSSAQFVETTAVPGNNSPGPPISVILVSPLPGAPYTGMAGTTSSTPIQVQVTGTNLGVSAGIPGVSLQITYPTGTSSGPTLTCTSQPGQQPGTVLTDTSGAATCMPVFGGKPGTGNYQVTVGGIYTFFAGALTVTPGQPSILKLISGNGQTVNPGGAAPMPLVAEVEDMAGDPYSGATVTWAVTAGSATLTNTVNTSASNGQVSTNITAGGTAGPVQITVTLANTSAQVTFTLNVNVVFNQLQIVSGNNSQTAPEGAAFADPLVVQVSDQVPSTGLVSVVPGITVNFTVTSGSATLSAASATTNAQGQAQVTVTAGATPGPVVITASVTGGQVPAVTFNLAVLPPGPVLTAAGFANAAGFQSQFISPCSLATIYGTGLATGIQGAVVAFIEPQLQLAGVSITFAGVPAPILSVVNENGQQSVSVQVPCEVTPGMVTATVTVNGASSSVMVNVMPVSPGIFQTVMSDGKLRALMIRPDGSVVQLENPARLGETIRAYVTGLGQTSPTLFTDEFDPLIPDASGNLVPEVLNVNAQIVVGVNNAGAVELSAQYAYGLVGVYQIEFVVPTNTATGTDVVFAIAVYQPDGTALFGNSTTMPIQ